MKYLIVLLALIVELVMAKVFTIAYFMWHFKFNKMFIIDAYEDIKKFIKT
jgi:hypothetical protein